MAEFSFFYNPRTIRVITWIGLILLVIPLLIWNYVPFQDYPSRIYEAHIYQELGRPNSDFNPYYERQTLWMTNRFYTIIYIALAQIMPIIWAGKISVMLLIVLYQWAVYYFIKKIRPELTWASLIQLLFTYHLYLVRGSVNYCYSAAFSLVALGMVLPALRDKNWLAWPLKNWAMLGGLVLLMVFTHPVPLWVFGWIMILMGLLFYQKIKWIISILISLLVGIPLLAVPFSELIFRFFGKISAGDPLVYPSLIGKITAIFGFPFTYRPLIYAGIIFPLLIIIGYSFKGNLRKLPTNPYFWMIVFLLVLVLSLPAGSVIMICSLDSRVATYLVPFGLLVLPSLSERIKRYIAIGFCYTFSVYIVFIFFIFYHFNHSLQGFDQLMKTMKSGKTMISYNDWNFSRPTSFGEIVDFLIRKEIVLPYTLIPVYYGIEKNAPGGPLFLIPHQCVIRELQAVQKPYYVFYVYNHTQAYQPADWVISGYNRIFQSSFMEIYEMKSDSTID